MKLCVRNIFDNDNCSEVSACRIVKESLGVIQIEGGRGMHAYFARERFGLARKLGVFA